MINPDTLTRRELLRLIGAAGLVVSCGGDRRVDAEKPDAGAGPHPATALDLSASVGFPTRGMALSAESIFIADLLPPGVETDHSGMIVAIPRRGGPVRPLATSQRNPYYLCLDGDVLYWANLEGGTPETSTVQRLSLTTGTIEQVARTNGRVLALSAGGGTLAYLVDEPRGDGSIAPVLFIGFGGKTPEAVGNAPLTSSGPLSSAGDAVYCAAIRDGDHLYQVFKYESGSTEARPVLDAISQIDVLDSQGIYVGSPLYEARYFDGRVVSLERNGIPQAIYKERLGISGFKSISNGITLFDLPNQKSQPLFALEHAVIAMTFDDQGVAWLEETIMAQHSGPPALFYFPCAS
ncbi:MAG: hypothetical protein QOI41_1010 [Myxococcales bacterium]|jgi:hypothetical protein|nr:hypothetical protein [Myxococcales bacterium]